MSRRNDTSKMKAGGAPDVRPDDGVNTEIRRQSAQSDIPQGPAKNQDKRSRG